MKEGGSDKKGQNGDIGRDFSLRPGNEKPLETHKRCVGTLWSREKVS